MHNYYYYLRRIARFRNIFLLWLYIGKELSTTDGGQGSQNSAIIGGSIGAVVAVAGAVILVIAVGVWCRVRYAFYTSEAIYRDETDILYL